MNRPHPWWLWPNLLSLDAPLVALVWQRLFAACFHVPVSPATAELLATAAWSIYVFDRLMDAARQPGARLGPRHRFYHRHRRVFWVLLAAVGAVSVREAFRQLPQNLLVSGLVLCGAVAVYLSFIHIARSRAASWFPKEFAVGALFAAGVTLPFWSRIDEWPAFVLFALACQVNTVGVEVWESAAYGKSSAAPPTLWLGRHLARAAALVCLTSAVALAASNRSVAPLFACLAASALAMWIVVRYRDVLGVTKSCILMDAALLTPLFAVIQSLPVHLRR